MSNTAVYKKLLLALVLGLTFFSVTSFYFTTQQALLIGTIAMLVTLWSNVGLPLGIVSLLPIILFPAFEILSTKATTMNYAHPIIFLFLGGFLIAIAVEKSNLHRYIASKMLATFPSTPRGVIFSLTISSGLLSSFLSNTATSLLLIPIAIFLSDNKALKMRFVLAVAYGASVGGILTPIGTPPNLILFGFLQDNAIASVGFVKWMYLVAPLVFAMMMVVSSLLSLGVKDLVIEKYEYKEKLNQSQKNILYVLGALIVTLLLNSAIEPYWSGLGFSEALIMLSFGVILFIPPFRELDWAEDRGKIPFEIIFLFGAGFSIAKAFGATGLAHDIALLLLDLTTLPPIILLVSVALLVTFTTEITSNTALISIILPIIYSVSQQSSIDATLFLMVATVCASYAFMLPIATAPNAIAMSSGVVDVKTMARYGVFLNIVGVALVVTIATLFWEVS
ncbi:MAG: DUF1646 domain-containing protein [Helicobacteraceae bacterium]|nr:DUF1646 domain-containing protein [Helicobacteraceae bacterium]